MLTIGMKWFRFGVLLLCLALMVGCSLTSGQGSGPQKQSTKPLIGYEEVAQYIRDHGHLPDNYITKNEARKLGWDAQKGNLNKVAPGKSIGGDVFGNREKKLPSKKGRIWYEADINYKSGFRGDDRILFSNDGLIYKTEDHYKTFQLMK
ncbi:ribonuclease domain-containing protein [Aneurinibacillus aneurinilyticus]